MQYVSFSDFTKILVVGGYNDNTGEFLDTAEVIDLTSEVQSCTPPANYPFPAHLMVGTLLDGIPTICGGHDATEPEPRIYSNKCYKYNHTEGLWTPAGQMLAARFAHGASMVDSKTWLISGGDSEPGVATDSMEVWRDGRGSDGPKLPSARRYHCQVTLNSSHVAILGGYNGLAEFSDFHLLDLESQEWTELRNAPFPVSNRPCGLIENSANGQELVVLISHRNCQIFNFREGVWKEGPMITDMYGVQFNRESMVAQMKKNFYVMGGQLDNGFWTTDAIYEFDPKNYEWVERDFRLNTPRRGGVAIPVPDQVVECQ